MSKSKGYILLYRDIWDDELWNTSEPFNKRDAWIDLILMANHKDKILVIGASQIVVHRGQLFTSLSKLSERWHWSRARVKRYIDLLILNKKINTSGIKSGTLISIVKYSDFQTSRNTNEYTDVTASVADDVAASVTQTNKYINNNIKKVEIKGPQAPDFLEVDKW